MAADGGPPPSGREEDVLRDLTAPIRSVRIFALEEAIRTGASVAWRQALQDRVAEEDDEECRMLLTHAQAAVARRLGSPPATLPFPGMILDWNTFPSLPEGERIATLCAIPRRDLSDQVASAAGALERVQETLTGGFLIRTFASVWPAERNSLLRDALRSGRLSVRLAALEVLAERSPQLLESQLPTLLRSEDPRTRLLAIRGLITLDEDEALAHLEMLLHSQHPGERRLAIQTCVHFPFSRVQPLLLAFLARESDFRLLDQAGLYFRINPSPEAPFRLVELVESMMFGDKAVHLDAILQGAVQALEDAKQLPEPRPAFEERLLRWRQRKQVERRVEETVASARAGEVPDVSDLQAFAADPRLRPLLEEVWRGVAGGAELAHLQQDVVEMLAPKGAPETSPSDIPSESVLAWPILPTCRAIHLLEATSIDHPDLPRIIEQILEDPSAPPEMKRAALRKASAARFILPEALCLGLLKHPSPPLVGSALEYLASFFPLHVSDLIGGFLKSSNIRLRTSAIKALILQDPTQARAIVGNLLLGGDRSRQELALGWLVHFDFPTIRGVLFEFLARDPPEPVFGRVLHFLASNPDAESLYGLYGLARKLPAREPLVNLTVGQVEKALIDSRQMTREALQALTGGMPGRWEKEQAKARQPAPPYAVRMVHPRADVGPDWGKTLFQQLRAMIPLVLLVGSLLLGVVLLYGPRGVPKSGSMEGNGPGPLSSGPQVVSGVVQENSPTNCLRLATVDGTRFLVLPDKKLPSALKTGDRVTLVLLPFRIDSSGVILARLVAP